MTKRYDRLKAVFEDLVRRAPVGTFCAPVRLVVDDRTVLEGRPERDRERGRAACGLNADGSVTVYVSQKLAGESAARQEGVLMHELGHATMLQHGEEDHSEEDADEVAKEMFLTAVRYDRDGVQTTDPRSEYDARPAWIDDPARRASRDSLLVGVAHDPARRASRDSLRDAHDPAWRDSRDARVGHEPSAAGQSRPGRLASRATKNPRAEENGRYVFVMDCTQSTYEDIQALQESEVAVSRQTFAKAIGKERWAQIQADLKYDRDFPIAKDWHVGYFKGVFRGVPAYFLRHSCIEHIFTLDGEVGPSLDGGGEHNAVMRGMGLERTDQIAGALGVRARVYAKKQKNPARGGTRDSEWDVGEEVDLERVVQDLNKDKLQFESWCEGEDFEGALDLLLRQAPDVREVWLADVSDRSVAGLSRRLDVWRRREYRGLRPRAEAVRILAAADRSSVKNPARTNPRAEENGRYVYAKKRPKENPKQYGGDTPPGFRGPGVRTEDMSPRELRDLAGYWEDNARGGTRAVDYVWRYEKKYPTDNFTHLMPDWRAWFKGERDERHEYFVDGGFEQWVKDGGVERDDDPVFILENEDGNVEQVWDGWHRIAASIIHGLQTIPAVVGRLKKNNPARGGTRDVSRLATETARNPERNPYTKRNPDPVELSLALENALKRLASVEHVDRWADRVSQLEVREFNTLVSKELAEKDGPRWRISDYGRVYLKKREREPSPYSWSARHEREVLRASRAQKLNNPARGDERATHSPRKRGR